MVSIEARTDPGDCAPARHADDDARCAAMLAHPAQHGAQLVLIAGCDVPQRCRCPGTRPSARIAAMFSSAMRRHVGPHDHHGLVGRVEQQPVARLDLAQLPVFLLARLLRGRAAATEVRRPPACSCRSRRGRCGRRRGRWCIRWAVRGRWGSAGRPGRRRKARWRGRPRSCGARGRCRLRRTVSNQGRPIQPAMPSLEMLLARVASLITPSLSRTSVTSGCATLTPTMAGDGLSDIRVISVKAARRSSARGHSS